MKPDRNNFAPRFGAVYKIGDKTLIRGGYGIFYNLFDRVGSGTSWHSTPRAYQQQRDPDERDTPAVMILRNGFPHRS